MSLTVKFPHAEAGDRGTFAVIHERSVCAGGRCGSAHRIGPLEADPEEVRAALRHVLAFRYPLFGTPPLTPCEVAAIERALARKITKMRKRRLGGS